MGQRTALRGKGVFGPARASCRRSQAGSSGRRRTGSHLGRERNRHVRALSQPWGTWAAGCAWRRGNPGLQLSCWHCLPAFGLQACHCNQLQLHLYTKMYVQKNMYGHVMASRAQRSNWSHSPAQGTAQCLPGGRRICFWAAQWVLQPWPG